ncbi:transposase, partial [Nostoc sp. HG1]|nr:transposase [Nostoc sp. HG1]
LVSRKVKGSSNRRKARNTLGRVHLKISRQRKDHAVKLARCVITIKRCSRLRRFED